MRGRSQGSAIVERLQRAEEETGIVAGACAVSSTINLAPRTEESYFLVPIETCGEKLFESESRVNIIRARAETGDVNKREEIGGSFDGITNENSERCT